MNQPQVFYLESYSFRQQSGEAVFRYSFDHERYFEEKLVIEPGTSAYNSDALERALRLAHIVAGTSYYKCFPNVQIDANYGLSESDVEFIRIVYREGMSQFMYENNLAPEVMGRAADPTVRDRPVPYSGSGVLALQSGGKDSLLLAELLMRANRRFTAFYVSSSAEYPTVLKNVGDSLRVARRSIDIDALHVAAADGALNGHVPVSFIVYAYAIVDAVLHNEDTILCAVGREGEEPYAQLGEVEITHQWSKTWRAEQLFAEYVHKTVTPDVRIGSPLRQWTELRISQLFSELAWNNYKNDFSSCNVGNYRLGEGRQKLVWCGECPKCANSYLLFSPFVAAAELQELFAGSDLFAKKELESIFRGLLGVDNTPKPFECVGETDELRLAYEMAQRRGGYESFDFDVPAADFDYLAESSAQDWTQMYHSSTTERGL